MQVLKADDYKRMPWKNGGGQTAEIAVSPPDAGLSGFDWRLSMATVASDGPFSSFPGVDRTLTILSGAGMILHGAEGQDVTLTRHSPPFSFAADEPISAVLVDAAVVDLNVMTRRDRLSHRVERKRPPFTLEETQAVCVVFCLGGTMTLGCGTSATRLQSYDCAILSACDLPMKLDGSHEVLVIEFAETAV